MKAAQNVRGTTASCFRSSLIYFNAHNLCIDFVHADRNELYVLIQMNKKAFN